MGTGNSKPGKLKQNIEKLNSYLDRYGLVGLSQKVIERKLAVDSYAENWKNYMVSAEEAERQRKNPPSYSPLISVLVPVCDPNEIFFSELVECIVNQTYANWQLCVLDVGQKSYKHVLDIFFFDDERVKYKRALNLGISDNTNECLKLATGDYIALLDHDDLLTVDALYSMVDKINENGYDCVYSDEDKINTDGSRHFMAHIKPDFDKCLLLSNNYICHLFMVKRSVALSVGGFRKKYDGAQDYDFILRCCDGRAVGHVDKILYHWRTHEKSTASNPSSKLYAYEAGKNAIADYLESKGVKANVSMLPDYGFYRVDYELTENPKVSICVDLPEKKLGKYTGYIGDNTSYDNYVILSKDSVVSEDSEYVVYLDGGMTFSSPDWLSGLVACIRGNDADAVAGKLTYDGKLVFANELNESYKIPEWYRGSFDSYIINSSISKLPKYGYIIKRCIKEDTSIKKGNSIIKDNSIVKDNSIIKDNDIIKDTTTRRLIYEPKVVFSLGRKINEV